MFDKSFEYYDLFKKQKDYKSEAIIVRDILFKLGYSSHTTILDVTCGTGEHDKYLSEYYNVSGLDINENFLQIARKKNPTGIYFKGDMVSFNVRTKFDVIICLYGGIGYAKNHKNLYNTLSCFNQHLKNGGHIIINPWYSPKKWKEGIYNVCETTDSGEYVRMSFGHQNGDITFHYLIGEKNGIKHFTEKYSFGLFDISEITNFLDNLNYSSIVDESVKIKRGLIIARKNG